MTTIAIIGGGITGLSAACALQQKIREGQLDARLELIEAAPVLGGKIHTLRDKGFIMETGADSIVSRKFHSQPLLEKLGLGGELVYNATGRSFLFIDGKLKPIPEDTVFGIPLSVESLSESELISEQGKEEALRDLTTPNDGRFTKEDSLGAFLRYFLGEEIVARQIAPVLSGVYSGRLDDLTIASTMPYLLDYKEEYGSIIRGLEANKHRFQNTGGGKFLSFEGGLSRLPERIAEQLEDVTIRLGTRALRLAKAEEGWTIELSGGQTIRADFVILAVLHTHAQQILQDTELNELFGQLQTHSLISVYLGYDLEDDVLPADGTGFITAGEDELTCSACTWTSRKWSHTSRHHKLLLRLFYKSSQPVYERLAKMSEAELLSVAKRDVERSIGIAAQPVIHAVTRWHEAMPVYHIRHQELVTGLEQELKERYPGVLIAGCSYYGVGIPDCMQSGEQAAERIIESISGKV